MRPRHADDISPSDPTEIDFTRRPRWTRTARQALIAAATLLGAGLALLLVRATSHPAPESSALSTGARPPATSAAARVPTHTPAASPDTRAQPARALGTAGVAPSPREAGNSAAGNSASQRAAAGGERAADVRNAAQGPTPMQAKRRAKRSARAATAKPAKKTAAKPAARGAARPQKPAQSARPAAGLVSDNPY